MLNLNEETNSLFPLGKVFDKSVGQLCFDAGCSESPARQ